MDLRLKGKVALIMASSKGLGFGCAKALAEEGCDIAICSRNKTNLLRAAERIQSSSNGKILTITANLRNEKTIKEVHLRIKDKLGSPDILIANTEGPPKGSFSEIETELYKKWFEIGTLRVIDMIKFCVPAMQQKMWGRIIAITSMSVKQPIQNLILSNTFRASLVNFLKTISTSLIKYNITVNSLLPGMHSTERILDLNKNFNLIDKIGDPKKFGKIAAFLASEHTDFITGQNLLVDGGHCKGI